jgi:hypothetical protein
MEVFKMKHYLRFAIMTLCIFTAGTAFAADKKTTAGPEKPSGIYEGINTEYDNYIMATYNFTGNKVKIATEKEDIDCVWTIDADTLSIFYIVDDKPSTEVYESWVWDASKKQYNMKDSSGLILKKKNK